MSIKINDLGDNCYECEFEESKLTFTEMPTIKKKLLDFVAKADSIKKLAFDFSNIDFFDSMALGTLLYTNAELQRKHDKRITIGKIKKESMMEKFNAIQLFKVFDIERGEEIVEGKQKNSGIHINSMLHNNLNL